MQSGGMIRLGLLAMLLVTVGVLEAADAPVQVTTDSVDYCRALGGRLATRPAAGQEPALSLGKEGRRLCDSGHVRTGIAKLRRAMRAADGAR
jgi:hypothetical protein